MGQIFPNKEEKQYYYKKKESFHSRIPRALIKVALEKVDLADVISPYVTLMAASKNKWKGLCPFHNDRDTPSLSVDDEKKFFHCFGCGASGDAITFIMKINNVSFKEAALNILRKAGMQIGESSNWIHDESALIRHSIDKNMDAKQNEDSSEFFTGSLVGDMLYIAETCYEYTLARKDDLNFFNKMEKLYQTLDDNYRFKNYDRLYDMCKNLDQELKGILKNE